MFDKWKIYINNKATLLLFISNALLSLFFLIPLITVPLEPFGCKQDMDENKFNEDPQKEFNFLGLLLLLLLLLLLVVVVVVVVRNVLLIDIDDLFILE